MKKIPYGIIDYKKLKEEDYLYVDKTPYIEKLENSEDTIIYLRPGRFGKSLFTSMMYYYYDINSKCLFDSLFKDTYIYSNQTPKKNSYYVLKFDFSGLTTGYMTESEMKQEFSNKVISGINNFLSYYGYDYSINKEKNPNGLLLDFLTYFNSLKLNNKLYILIDEYDNFTNGILEGDASLFKSVVNENGFIKSFYAIIKEYVGLGIIDGFFATGICPVTLNSMTTGFNIAVDKSTHKDFNTMIGLTHKEVLDLLDELDLTSEEKNTIFEVMKKNYDGYLFSTKLGEENRVFNATLVMYFLKEYLNNHEVPDVLYDNNIVVNYGKIENLIKLQDNKYYKEIISDILDNDEIIGNLKTAFNLLEDFTRDDIISLLYYFGYLTIKEPDDLDIVFTLPNKIMKDTYSNFFNKILSEYVDIDTNKIRECVKEIAETGEITKITNYVEEILKETSNRIFIKFDEKYLQLLYYNILRNTSKFETILEKECINGFIDIYIEGKNNLILNNIIIELKYIKKKNYTDSLLDSEKSKAISQINDYSKDSKINSLLRKYIVIFVGDELRVLEEVR